MNIGQVNQTDHSEAGLGKWQCNIWVAEAQYHSKWLSQLQYILLYVQDIPLTK